MENNYLNCRFFKIEGQTAVCDILTFPKLNENDVPFKDWEWETKKFDVSLFEGKITYEIYVIDILNEHTINFIENDQLIKKAKQQHQDWDQYTSKIWRDFQNSLESDLDMEGHKNEQEEKKKK